MMISRTKLEVKNLGKRYGNTWIFKSFSFVLEAGDTLILEGYNGSGKSTLLKILSSTVPATEGSIHFLQDGKEIDSSKVPFIQGFAAPYQELIEEFTLMELLQFQSDMKPWIDGMAFQAIPELLMLSKDKHKQIAKFSSGMKQRLKLGLALFAQNEVLLFDEPSSNLDVAGVEWYRKLLLDFRGGRSLILCSNQKQEYDWEGFGPFLKLSIEAFKP